MRRNINDLIVTRVIEAGGRYGMHPTWKAFTGELNYFSFEPDRAAFGWQARVSLDEGVRKTMKSYGL